MKKYLLIIIALVVLIFAGWYVSSKRTSVSITGEPVGSASYACVEGKTIDATFYEAAAVPVTDPNLPPVPSGSVSLELSDGRSMVLAQTISASGIRYANQNESFVFWSKGNGALVLENDMEKDYVGCVRVAPESPAAGLSRVYVEREGLFSLRLPALSASSSQSQYVADESYEYQLAPGRTIAGTKFTIPSSVAEGTNLSKDSYISIEHTSGNPACTADAFFDGAHAAQEYIDGETLYSMASSSNAGAGNRYEETVYAMPGTDPCLAVRYFIHYGAIQNYEPDTVREFDKNALIQQFDAIRRTLVVNQ